MEDIIRNAIDKKQDTKERTATGQIEGHEVLLVKREYKEKQLGPTSWKVAAYIDDETIASEQVKKLEPDEAQERFEKLRDKYDLK